MLIAACSSSPEVEKAPYLSYPPELAKVSDLMERQKYADARTQVEDYLNKAENINWYGHAWFLKAFIYESEQNFPKAIKYYKAAIDHGKSLNSKVAAKSLYNLSFVYERTENKKNMLSTLIDLMKRRSFFDPLTAEVEIPARLAATFAALDRLKQAQKYHSSAVAHFNQMARKQNFSKKGDELSKALFYLGLAVLPAENESYDELITKLRLGQNYFLASVEASGSKWAERASERLQGLYNQAWDSINTYAPEGYDHDPQAKRKQQQRRQLVMASELYDLNLILQAAEFPLTDVNRRSRALLSEVRQWQDRLEAFALKLDVGAEVTRNKKLKNKPLAVFVEKKQKPVVINKEKVIAPVKATKSVKKNLKEPQVTPSSKLPEKKVTEDIGKDPNL